MMKTTHKPANTKAVNYIEMVIIPFKGGVKRPQVQVDLNKLYFSEQINLNEKMHFISFTPLTRKGG